MAATAHIASAPLYVVHEFVCAWCGSGISRPECTAPGDSTNYGMCDECLHTRLAEDARQRRITDAGRRSREREMASAD